MAKVRSEDEDLAFMGAGVAVSSSHPPTRRATGPSGLAFQFPGNQIDHVTDILQFLQLPEGEPHAEGVFHSGNEIDVHEGVPTINGGGIGASVDNQSRVFKDLLKDRAKTIEDIIHSLGTRQFMLRALAPRASQHGVHGYQICGTLQQV